jgi:hypothetical protein
MLVLSGISGNETQLSPHRIVISASACVVSHITWHDKLGEEASLVFRTPEVRSDGMTT